MHPLLTIATLVLAVCVAGPVRADTALQQLLADSARAPVVGFERTTRRLVAERNAATLVVDRFVPTSAKDGKWTLVAVDGRRPTTDEAKAHLKSDLVSVIPGFHRLHIVLGAPPTSRSEAGGRSTYRWASLPKGAVETPGGDISTNLSAEAIVDTVNGRPLIAQVRIFASRPFTLKGIARMNVFDVTSRYRLDADNRPVLTSQTSISDVKAPFGLGGKRHRQFEFRSL